MKAILLGTDFAYTKDGNVTPIEINTNSGIDNLTLENKNDIFNLETLKPLITKNSITKITYLGAIELLNRKLDELSLNLSIEYEFIQLQNSEIIPDIEDNDVHLIIRSAYDTNAIVDSVYCRDKTNFMNLINSKSFKSEYAYHDGINLINKITEIPDNGNHPNFILKARYPQYDKDEYPKLYKVTTFEELDIVLENVNFEYFLMEFHLNPNKVYQGNLKIIRSWNLLVAPTLENITLGNYTRITSRKLDELSTFNPNTYELTHTDRTKYLTILPKNSPKLGSTDKVEMADETFKTGEELQVGDLVKTLIIPNPDNIDLANDLGNFGITYETFTNETVYSSNKVLEKIPVNILVDQVRILFTDDTFWGDTKSSNYLILRNNEVRFVSLDESRNNFGLKEEDQIILVDTGPVEFTSILKTVSAIITTVEMFNGYQIEIEETHIFLSQDSENQSYVAIEHNPPCDPGTCGRQDTCAKGEDCQFGICVPGPAEC